MENVVQKKSRHEKPPTVPRPPTSIWKNDGRASGEAAATGRTAQNQAEDAKRMKRIMASRQYSQKYRLKQMQYIIQLETEMKALQAEVAIVAPRIKYSDRQNSLLRAENIAMKHKLSAFTGELSFKEAQYEELKRERQMLKHLYMMQQQQHQQAVAADHWVVTARADDQQIADMNAGLFNQGFNFL